jgi:hypothetical protein
MKPSLFSNVCKHTKIKTVGVIVLLLLALPMLSGAKSPNPVKWTFEAKKMSSGVYELHLIARIDAGWRIYSQYGGNGTLLPTLIRFNSSPLITIQGKTEEAGKMKKSVGKGPDMGMSYFVELVNFKQIVRLNTGTSSATITGGVQYSAVNGKTMLPPKSVNFSIMVK